MWRISLMAAAHGDPLRQSQRRSGNGNNRDDLYPIDFQAYQMSPTCAGGCHCTPTEDSNFNATDEITTMPTGIAVVSDDAAGNLHYGKEPPKDMTAQKQPHKKVFRSMPQRLCHGFRRMASSIRHGWRRFTCRHCIDSRPPDAEGKIGSDFSKKSKEDSSWNCCRNFISVDPTLPFHYRWMLLVSTAVLYNLIFVLGRAVFWELNNAVPHFWWFLDYTCDTIYLVDFIIHAHEGYLEQGLLVNDSSKLRRHYLSTGKWKTDILSLLPTDMIYYWWPPNSCSKELLPCPVIVRVNRLLRLPRMCEFFDRTETGTGYPNAFRICKVVLAILVLIHWNACFYFAISYVIGFGRDNWVYNINGDKNSTLTRQYIYSFYWSTLTLTTIGETPQPENDAEYLFVVADFLAGVLIFATIVGNIGSMISNMNLARVDFQNRMDGVKQYMAFRKVSKDLEARVIRWFAYTWANKQALDEDRVLAALPDKLKAEIAIHVHLDTLKQVRIFQDCEPGLLEELVLKLRLQVFSPGDYICRKGDVGKEMYIVKRGRLSVVADDGETVLATLGSGSVFGEVSVLEIAGNRTGNRRTANVRSLGYSDLFCLAKRDLWEALIDYPEARHSLMERGCQLLRKDGLLDENAFKKSQAEHETLKDKVDRLEHSLENLEEKLTKVRSDLSSCQARIKRRSSRIDHKPKPLSPMKTLLPPLTLAEESNPVRTTRRSFQGTSRPSAILQREKQRTKRNWNDSTESIQKQKVSKLTKSDTSATADKVNLLLLESRPLRLGKESRTREEKPEADEISEDAILYVMPKNSNSGELAVLKVTLSRPESRIFLPDTANEYPTRPDPAVEMDIVEIINGSEDAPKDRVPWKYLRRGRVYEKEKGKFLISWLRSVNFHCKCTRVNQDNRLLRRRRMILTCPNCTLTVKTCTKHVISVRTRRSACALSVFGLCGLPYALFLFKDVVHLCPFCSIYLGFCPAFKYQRKTDVQN